MIPIFKSIDSNYKDPVGAVEINTPVHFKIIISRSLSCRSAELIVIDDYFNRNERLGLFWCGITNNDYDMWECHFCPSHEGLYFYRFEVNISSGIKQVALGSLLDGTLFPEDINKNLPMFQLTVYKKGFTTPDWLSGGIMYQIFPDRFFRSSKLKKNVPDDKILRDDWYGVPEFDENKNSSDYFCADLKGIEEKLDYLKSLEVTCLYLNPIFESHSNHRYNTADYTKIDPLLGSHEDFKSLCISARKKGIRIILDGVFNHTGDDSIYFNKNNRYPEPGAYNSKDSKFFSWYKFTNWPYQYNSWWGVTSLPETDKFNKDYREFINGENGIVKKWLKEGASGWRLDVADELPDEFIEEIRNSSKSVDSNALILGEVWEDATTKKGFGKRRKYFLGSELDSVMNYPFREAIIKFLSGSDAKDFVEQILSIVENYPKQVTRNLMNILGTHDTERIITILAGEKLELHDKLWQSQQCLSQEQKSKGIKLMKLASLIQYTLPGVPCIYYGDEAGLQGYKDPFCRRCYPWEQQEKKLLSWYKTIGKLRKECKVLKDGDFIPFFAQKHVLAYERQSKDDFMLCVFNSSQDAITFKLPDKYKLKKCFWGQRTSENMLTIGPVSGAILF